MRISDWSSDVCSSDLHEVAWGRLDGLKAFCLTQALPFVRWSGGYPGQFGPERAVFTGAGEVRLYAADEEDYIVICLATAEQLASYDAILAHFAAADFTVPPLDRKSTRLNSSH